MEKTYDVCPDCGAEDQIVKTTVDPCFRRIKEMCTKCFKNVTGRVIKKSWINHSGWKA